jgi:hypothetical protein
MDELLESLAVLYREALFCLTIRTAAAVFWHLVDAEGIDLSPREGESGKMAT